MAIDDALVDLDLSGVPKAKPGEKKSYKLTIARVMEMDLELRTDENDFEHIVWHGLEDGEDKTLYWEPHTSFWERFSMGFLRLVPAESQL